MEDVMAKDLNGAWLALGVVGAAAAGAVAASVMTGRGTPNGSRARDGSLKTFVPVTMLGRGGAAEYAKNARGTLIYRFWETPNDPWKLVAT